MSRILELHPDKACYRPDEKVRLEVTVETETEVEARVLISRMADTVEIIEREIAGSSRFSIDWEPPGTAPRGYGADLELRTPNGTVLDRADTAFDVLSSWTERPRYGFLSDFEDDLGDVSTVMGALTHYHINGIQFYDWMYKHDDPVSPTELFIDPLGRELSRSKITALVAEAHRRGIEAMAYLAVYAASREFWRERPDLAMYDEAGSPIPFGEDFLGLMDPTGGGGWSEHLLERASQTLQDFDGIHIDQYGEPHVGYRQSGERIDIPRAFADFVTELKQRHPDRPLTFNAVKNWPIEELAASPIDFAYIELWPDMPTYAEVGSVVRTASRRSGKPIVIALYIPAEHEANVKLANSVISSNGGCRIEMGQNARLLTDPYFPNHQAVSPLLDQWLHRAADIRVRYGDALESGSEISPAALDAPEGISATSRRSENWIALSLVNARGLGNARWDEEHGEPEPVEKVQASIDLAAEVSAMWWVTPDREPGSLTPVEWDQSDRWCRLEIPLIEFSGNVFIQLTPDREKD